MLVDSFIAMEEIIFEIDHKGCPFVALSKKYHNMQMWHWCNLRVDVFETYGAHSPEMLDELARLAQKAGGQAETDLRENGGRIILSAPELCPCNRILRNSHTVSVTALMEQFHCMPLEPISYSNGLETRRMISLDEEKQTLLFDELNSIGQTRIVLKRKIGSGNLRDFFTIPLSTIFGNLTEKQYSTVRNALREGYYDIPRKASVRVMSLRKRIPRSTMEEHLHKGESKIMKSISPYIMLYGGDERAATLNSTRIKH